MTRLQGWTIGLLGLVLLQQVLFTPAVQAAGCFRSVFAFGDGMFDTGGISAVFPSMLGYDYPPYGDTFFKKPSGRFSDGRLIVDFITESLGLPRIPSYFQTVFGDYSFGVSFASAFSTIATVSTGHTAGPFMFLSPFALSVQLLEYLEFRSTTAAVIRKNLNSTNSERSTMEATKGLDGTDPSPVGRLPADSEFGTGLYLFHTGVHDIVNFYNLKLTDRQIEDRFPALFSTYSLVIRSFAKLYGVKNIIVFDIEPLGCQPFLLTLIPHTEKDLDSKGCLIAQNALVQRFNARLKDSVQNWRRDYKADIYYLSQYDIKIDLMKDATSGFTTTNVACCGVPASPYNVAIPVPCGPPTFDPSTNSTILATACASPSSYLYWDGMFTTEAANKYITEKILSGAYFDRPFEALTSCASNPLS